MDRHKLNVIRSHLLHNFTKRSELNFIVVYVLLVDLVRYDDQPLLSGELDNVSDVLLGQTLPWREGEREREGLLVVVERYKIDRAHTHSLSLSLSCICTNTMQMQWGKAKIFTQTHTQEEALPVGLPGLMTARILG